MSSAYFLDAALAEVQNASFTFRTRKEAIVEFRSD